MTCSAYWHRQVQTRILGLYPKVRVIGARAYEVPHTMPQGVVPAISRSEGDPIKDMQRFLKQTYTSDMEQDALILMYHPRGGFSYLDTRNLAG